MPGERSDAVCTDNAPSQLEHSFKVTVECAPVGIAHVSPAGEWLWVNDRLCAIVGYTRAELLAHTFQDMTHPDDLAVNLAQAERLLAGEIDTSTLEQRYLHKDGSSVWVHLTVSLIRDDAGAPQYFVAVVEDISARKRLEDALRQAEQMAEQRARETEAIFEAMSDGVSVYGEDGRLLRLNHMGRLLLGLDAQPEYFSRPYSKRSHEYIARDICGDVLPPEQWPIARVLRGETIASTDAVEVTVNGIDGRERTLSFSGAPVREAAGGDARFVLVYRDMTERRRLERQMLARAAETEATVEAMTDGVILCDADGHILRANEAFRRLIGYAPDSNFLSTQPEERGSVLDARDEQGRAVPTDQLPVSRVLRGEVLNGANVQEIQFRRLDGRVLQLGVSGEAIRDGQGRITGAVLVYRDVTERRRLERERADMLNIVSHELKTPLTSMKVRNQLLLRRVQRGVAPTPEQLEQLDRDMTRLQRLVDDLNEAARVEAGTLDVTITRFDLAELCERAAEEQTLGTGRAIRLDLPADPLVVEADAARSAQVLTNLLTNALKYSPPDRPVLLSLRREGALARVSVRDEGPGIPASALHRVFERFYRVPGTEVLHGTGVGLGLGLYISRSLIEHQGGSMGVESVEGQGATFFFTLPIAQGE